MFKNSLYNFDVQRYFKEIDLGKVGREAQVDWQFGVCVSTIWSSSQNANVIKFWETGICEVSVAY